MKSRTATLLAATALALAALPSDAGATPGYLTSGQGLESFDTGSWTPVSVGAVSAPNPVMALAAASGGALWATGSIPPIAEQLDKTNGGPLVSHALDNQGSGGPEVYGGATDAGDGKLWLEGSIYPTSGDPTGQLYSFDTASGTYQPVGSPQPQIIVSLASDCDGKLYGVDGAYRLVHVSTTDGTFNVIGPLSSFSDPQVVSLAFDHSEGTLFAIADSGLLGPPVYQVDPATGAMTLASAVSSGTPQTLTIDSLAQCRFPTQLSLRHVAHRPSFKGKVSSESSPCLAGRRIKVFRARKGPDAFIGSANSGASGKFKVQTDHAPKHNDYYAKTSRRAPAFQATCLAGRSPTVHLGH